MTSDRDVPYGSMILLPGLITLGVTLLRLTGERLGWSKAFFNPEPGGGGALVGIVWLIPIFGILFALKLAGLGHGPAGLGKAFGLAFAAFALMVAIIVSINALKLPFVASLFLIGVGSIAGIALAWRGWPELAKALLLYGFAARLPVAAVALVAMLGDWKTHYDVSPPELPAMGVWPRFFMIGLMPQMTIWLFVTVVLGLIFGSVAYAAAGKRVRVAA